MSERLDAIEARAANCRTYNFGMRAADKLTHEDVWDLLVLARKQQAAIDAVTKIVDEKYRLWAAICGNTCSKDILGVDHEAIADELAALIRAAITGEGGA